MTPEDAGLPRARLEDLKGGEPAENARRLVALLDGEKGPLRDVVLLNAAAALIVAGKADGPQGRGRARRRSRSATAARARRSAQLVAITNEPAPPQ